MCGKVLNVLQTITNDNKRLKTIKQKTITNDNKRLKTIKNDYKLLQTDYFVRVQPKALILMKLKKYREALEIFEKVIELNIVIDGTLHASLRCVSSRSVVTYEHKTWRI